MPQKTQGLRIDWGPICFVLSIALISSLYLIDTVSVSTNRNNVILVLPLSALIIGLCSVVIVRNIHWGKKDSQHTRPANSEPSESSAEVSQSPRDMLRALALLSLLGGYVLTFEWIGFDVATFIFIALSLLLLGHRKPWFVFTYSLIFTLVVIGGAMALLSYPMPMTIL